MKQQFLINTGDTFQTYIYENNRKAVPSSALLTVYKPGGDAKLINNAAMAIGADGLLTYALSAVDNAVLGINYKAVISYVYNAKTYYVTVFYDVVNSKLLKVITDEDIVAELPQIKDNGWRVRGAADSGSATAIVDADLKRYDDNFFTGGLAYSISKDETREITNFVSNTGTVTTTSFSSAIAAGEAYILSRSFSREIQRAFEKVEERLIRLGKRPQLILDPYDLREAHILYSVAEVCKGLSTLNQDFWWEMWKEYEKKAGDVFNSINFKYDTSGDGYIAGSEDNQKIDALKAGRR